MSTLSNAEYLRRLKQGGVGYNTNSSNFDAYLNNQMLQNSDYRDYLQQSLTNANNQPKLYSKDTQETLDKANQTLEQSKSFLNDLGRFEYNFTKGFFNFFEGVGDFVIGLAGGIGKMFGADDQWAQDAINFDWSSRAALLSQNFQINNMLGKAFQGINPFDAQEWDMSDEGVQRILDRYNNQGVAKDILPEWLVNGVDELASTVGQMLPSIALGGYVGTAGKALGWTQKAINFGSKLASVGAMSLSAAGNATGEALQENDDLGSALAYGAASGTVEGVSEYVFGWLTKGAGAAMTKMNLDGSKLANLLPNSVSGWFGKEVSKNFAVQISKEFVEEGAEEVFSDLMNPLIKSIYNGKSVSENYEELDPQELLHSFVMGGMTTLVMGGANIATDINLGKNGREAKGYLNDGMNAYYEMQELVKNNEATTLDAVGNTVASPKMIELQNKITNAKLQLENIYSKMTPTELGKFYKNVTGENLSKRYTNDINEVKEGIKNIDNQIQVATEANPNAVEPLENLKKTLLERQSFLEKGQDNYINSYSNSLINSSFKNLTKENAIYDVKTANHEKALKKYVRSLSEKSKAKLETARNEYIKSINDMVKNPSDFDIKTIANNLYEVSNELADDFDNYDATKLVTDYLDSINTLEKDVNKYVFNAIITKSKMSSKVVYASGDSLESKDIKGFYLPNDNTIVINSDYINKSPEIFAHEFFGHAIGKSISSDQLNNLYSKISLTKWYRENIDNILKDPRYNELYTKNKAKFKEEILANYLSGLFDNSDNYKQNLRVLRGLFLNKDFYKPFSQFIKSDFSKSILKNDGVFNNFITVLNDLLGTKEAQDVFTKYNAGLSGIMNSFEKKFFEENKEAFTEYSDAISYSVDFKVNKDDTEIAKKQAEWIEESLENSSIIDKDSASNTFKALLNVEQEKSKQINDANSKELVKVIKTLSFDRIFEVDKKTKEPIKDKKGNFVFTKTAKETLTLPYPEVIKAFNEKASELAKEKINSEIALSRMDGDVEAKDLLKTINSLKASDLFKTDKAGKFIIENGQPVQKAEAISELGLKIRNVDDSVISSAFTEIYQKLYNDALNQEVQTTKEDVSKTWERLLTIKTKQEETAMTQEDIKDAEHFYDLVDKMNNKFSEIKIDGKEVQAYCDEIMDDIKSSSFNENTALKITNLYFSLSDSIHELDELNIEFQRISKDPYAFAAMEISASQGTEILKKMNQLRFNVLAKIGKPAREVFSTVNSLMKVNNLDVEKTRKETYENSFTDKDIKLTGGDFVYNVQDLLKFGTVFKDNTTFLSGLKLDKGRDNFIRDFSALRKPNTGRAMKISETFENAKSISGDSLIRKTGFLKAGENRSILCKEVSKEAFDRIFNDKTHTCIRYAGKDTGNAKMHYIFVTNTNSSGEINGSGFAYYYKSGRDYKYNNTIVINKIFSEGDNDFIYKNIGIFAQSEVFNNKKEKADAVILSIEVPETNIHVEMAKTLADYNIIPSQRLYLENDKIPSYLVFAFSPSNSTATNLAKVPTSKYRSPSAKQLLEKGEIAKNELTKKSIYGVEQNAINGSRKSVLKYNEFRENEINKYKQQIDRLRKAVERKARIKNENGNIIVQEKTKYVRIAGTYSEAELNTKINESVRNAKKEQKEANKDKLETLRNKKNEKISNIESAYKERIKANKERQQRLLEKQKAKTEALKQKEELRKVRELEKKKAKAFKEESKRKIKLEKEKTEQINRLTLRGKSMIKKALTPLNFAYLNNEPIKNLITTYSLLNSKYSFLYKQVGLENSLKEILGVMTSMNTNEKSSKTKNVINLNYLEAVLNKTRIISSSEYDPSRKALIYNANRAFYPFSSLEQKEDSGLNIGFDESKKETKYQISSETSKFDTLKRSIWKLPSKATKRGNPLLSPIYLDFSQTNESINVPSSKIIDTNSLENIITSLSEKLLNNEININEIEGNYEKELSSLLKTPTYDTYVNVSDDYFANAMKSFYDSSSTGSGLNEQSYSNEILSITEDTMISAANFIEAISAQYKLPTSLSIDDISKFNELGEKEIENLKEIQISDHIAKFIPNENKGDTTTIDLTSKQAVENIEKEPWRKIDNKKGDKFKVVLNNSIYNIKNSDTMALGQILFTNKDAEYERGLVATGAFNFFEASAASYERRRVKNIANLSIQKGVLKFDNNGKPIMDSNGIQSRCKSIVDAETIMEELAGDSGTKSYLSKFKRNKGFSSSQQTIRKSVFLYGDLMRQLDINNYYMKSALNIFNNFFELSEEETTKIRNSMEGATEVEIEEAIAKKSAEYNEKLLTNTIKYFKDAIESKKSFNNVDFQKALKTDEINILKELGDSKDSVDEIKERLANALDSIEIKNVFGESCEKDYFKNSSYCKNLLEFFENPDDFIKELDSISPSNSDYFMEDFEKAVEKSKKSEDLQAIFKSIEEKIPLDKEQSKYLKQYKTALKEARQLFNSPSNDRISSTINSLYDIVPQAKMEEIWNIFWDNLRNARNSLVHYGRLSSREANLFDEVYPHYVPLKRLKISGMADSGRSTDIMSIVREFKGSNEVIAPLSNNIVDFIYSSQIVGVLNAQLNRAYQSGNYTKNNYMMFAEEKELPRITNAFDLSAVEETFEPELGSNTLKFIHYDENNEKHVINAEFNKYAYESITDSFYRMPLELRGLSKFGSIFRNAVTEWNPFFIARNMTRDLADALLTSKHGSAEFGKEYFKSLYEISKGDSALFNLYIDNGGLASSMFNGESSYELSQKMLNYKKEQSKKNKLNPFYWVSRANEIIEMTPRFTEFKLSFEKYVKEGMEESMAIKQAMYDAANVTTDFSRGGKAAKWLNRNLIPFLNAQIQGACKTVNIFLHPKDKKELAKLFAKILLWGLLPQLLNEILNWGNDDYEALPTYTKEQYWLIPLSNGTFIKIPKGHILGTFNTMFQNLIWTLKGDVNVGEGMKNTLESVSSNIAPVDLGTGLRTIFSPISDIKNNTTWYGQSIDKQSDLNKRPSSRYDSDTSEISKAIGKLFNYSPKRINYLLEQYTGVVGDIILPLTAESGFKTGIGGSLSSFIESNTTISSVKNSKYRGEFYDLRQETLYDANDGSASSRIVYSYITRALKDINELEDQADSAVNNAEQYTAYLTVRQAYQSAITNAKALKESLDQMVLTEENSREEITEAYRQTFGAAEALRYYNKNAYSKATIGNKFGLTYDNYYQLYFLARSLSTKAEVKALVRNYVGNDTYKMCAVMKLLGVQLSDEEKAKAKSYLSKRVDKEDLELLKL